MASNPRGFTVMPSPSSRNPDARVPWATARSTASPARSLRATRFSLGSISSRFRLSGLRREEVVPLTTPPFGFQSQVLDQDEVRQVALRRFLELLFQCALVVLVRLLRVRGDHHADQRVHRI